MASGRSEPQRTLDQVAVDRNPLSLASLGNRLVGMSRPQLDAGGLALGALEHPVEVWRIVGRIEFANRTSRLWAAELAPGRIEEQAIELCRVNRGDIGLVHGCVFEWREVVGGNRRGNLGELKSVDLEAE